MEAIKLALFCAAALVPLVLLKKQTAEQAILLTAGVLVLILYRCLSYVMPIIDTLESLFVRAGIESAYFSVLLRSVAASLVTRLCADLCRDGGSQALASLVEIVGTVAALLISMPVLETVIKLLLSYLG